MKNKCSRYNIYLPDENLIFNTRKLSLIELDKDANFKISSEKFDEFTEEEVAILKQNGIIVPFDVNELDLMKIEYWNNKINNEVLHISIMTTLKCNFKCIYCFEKRNNIDLTDIKKTHFGMTFLIFGITLIAKDGDELASLIGNAVPFLCGLYFPVTILPTFLKQISFIFPFTWGIDIIRNLMLNTNTIFNFKFEFVLLFIISILYLILGVLSYKLLEKKSRKIGVKGF